jgi:hypothetical protein
MDGAKRIRLVLWATTRVGKTTLLATALYGNGPELARIRREGPHGSVNQHLFDVWYRLNHNQWVQATSADWTAIVLITDSGVEIELIDIRGGMALEIGNPATRELLASCDGILFLAEFDGPEAGSQMAAIDGAAVEAVGKLQALAFTKCERWLTYDDPVWDRGEGWLERTQLWSAHSGTLARFQDCAWPTSAFGYGKSALPAVILGEMGQILPFQISPRNTAKPLAWMLRKLGCL